MKKGAAKKGFTIIEVSLVLAITGMMFVGIMSNTSSVLAKQRYKDSVNYFAETIRSTYSEVENTQNTRMEKNNHLQCTASSDIMLDPSKDGIGQSDCALYGKLIGIRTDGTYTIYDVVGDDYAKYRDSNDGEEIANDTEVIEKLAFDVLARENQSGVKITYAGNYENGKITWGAKLKTTSLDGSKPLQGYVLIFRSPVSHTVKTYARLIEYNVSNPNAFYDPQRYIGQATSVATGASSQSLWNNIGTRDSNPNRLMEQEVNFCVYSEDIFGYGDRAMNIRIKQGAKNSSGVTVADFDSGDNKCKH